MSAAILPRDSGFYVRAIADANDSHGRYAGDLAIIPQIGRTVVPDDWMPWLLRNGGLQGLMPYVDWATLWARGPAWLYIRGTPQASVDALSWIGWDVRFEDGAIGAPLYDHYHIHLPRVPTRAEIGRIVGVEAQAKSTDSVFFRLVHGLDARPVIGGESAFGEAIFADYSGVDIRPDWPRLSFEEQDVAGGVAGVTVTAAETLLDLARVTPFSDVVFAESGFGSRMAEGPMFGLDLSEGTAVLGSVAGHRAVDTIEPVAGVVGGVSIFADWQARPIAMRKIVGDTPMFADAAFGDAILLADVEQLLRVPDPIEDGAILFGGAEIDLSEDLTDLSRLLLPQSATVIADRLPGPARDGARAHTRNAPWSGLPWGTLPLGESPRVHATEETL